MKVRQLVERLEEFDPETEVWIKDASDFNNDYEVTDVEESKTENESGESYQIVLLG